MKVKIIKGVYGYRTKQGFVSPKTPESAPFDLPEEKAKELVNRGIAEFVENSAGDGQQTETPASQKQPNYFFMKTKELEKLAKAKKIDITGLKKAEIIAKLQEIEPKKEPETAENEGNKPENEAENGKNPSENDGAEPKKEPEAAENEGKNPENSGQNEDDEDEIVDDDEPAPTFDTTGAIK